MPLTARRRRFAALYATGQLSGAEAARQAGYSPVRPDDTAWRLQRSPEVAAEIASYGRSLLEQAGTSALEAVRVTRSVMQDAEQRAADRLRAAELVLRLDGALSDRVEGPRYQDQRVQVLAALSPGDLADLARLLAAPAAPPSLLDA